MLEAIGVSFRDKVKQPCTPRRIMVNLVLFGLMTGLIGIAEVSGKCFIKYRPGEPTHQRLLGTTMSNWARGCTLLPRQLPVR